jgi:hypothetical protein
MTIKGVTKPIKATGNVSIKGKIITLKSIFNITLADFGIIFREFTKRAGIYGFGDLQVKRLLKELDS